MPEMKQAPTHKVDIYIAGDYDIARNACREWCMRVGACVTVEPVEYVYTGGAESGVRVGFINYPRFPETASEIESKALALADFLLTRLFQHSYSIVTPAVTYYHSRREAGK